MSTKKFIIQTKREMDTLKWVINFALRLPRPNGGDQVDPYRSRIEELRAKIRDKNQE